MMDPDVVWRIMNDTENPLWLRADFAKALIHWLDGNGYLPDEVEEEVAYEAARTLISEANDKYGDPDSY